MAGNPCRIVAALVLVVLAVGCSAPPIVIAPKLEASQVRLGPASGEACGQLVLFAIPARLNGRVARAYQQALESVPGATALASVTLQESWHFWVLGMGFCTRITGEAVQ
jgi:hypothetical protein